MVRYKLPKKISSTDSNSQSTIRNPGEAKLRIKSMEWNRKKIALTFLSRDRKKWSERICLLLLRYISRNWKPFHGLLFDIALQALNGNFTDSFGQRLTVSQNFYPFQFFKHKGVWPDSKSESKDNYFGLIVKKVLLTTAPSLSTFPSPSPTSKAPLRSNRKQITWKFDHFARLAGDQNLQMIHCVRKVNDIGHSLVSCNWSESVSLQDASR